VYVPSRESVPRLRRSAAYIHRFAGIARSRRLWRHRFSNLSARNNNRLRAAPVTHELVAGLSHSLFQLTSASDWCVVVWPNRLDFPKKKKFLRESLVDRCMCPVSPRVSCCACVSTGQGFSFTAGKILIPNRRPLLSEKQTSIPAVIHWFRGRTSVIYALAAFEYQCFWWNPISCVTGRFQKYAVASETRLPVSAVQMNQSASLCDDNQIVTSVIFSSCSFSSSRAHCEHDFTGNS
jgi:hypothetical protein